MQESDRVDAERVDGGTSEYIVNQNYLLINFRHKKFRRYFECVDFLRLMELCLMGFIVSVSEKRRK